MGDSLAHYRNEVTDDDDLSQFIEAQLMDVDYDEVLYAISETVTTSAEAQSIPDEADSEATRPEVLSPAPAVQTDLQYVSDLSCGTAAECWAHAARYYRSLFCPRDIDSDLQPLFIVNDDDDRMSDESALQAAVQVASKLLPVDGSSETTSLNYICSLFHGEKYTCAAAKAQSIKTILRKIANARGFDTQKGIRKQKDNVNTMIGGVLIHCTSQN